MAHNLSPLQQALAAWTEQWKDQPQMRLYRLQESWPEVVGKILAKKSFIGQYDGATVTVLADNSVWLNELFTQEHIPALTAAQKEEVAAFFTAVPDPTLQQSLIHLRERQLALELARREAGFVPCTICHQLTDAVDGICEMCKLRAQAQERIEPRELTEDHVHNLLAKFARKAEDK